MRIGLILMILAVFAGLVLIDVDHITQYPIFHYMGTIAFFLFFAIGLLIFRKDDEEMIN